MIAVQDVLQQDKRATRMVMQVHDELVFEADESFVDELLSNVPALMTGAAQLRVPLVVDSGVGDNWDEAH